ncbi:coniferyl-aldehyde dehydrogenase [Vibrio sp. 10N.286.49.C2]|uniref:coniferyl aldehyde dehydrogenase n=1 Tax=unclassified Vibrio TaxID=2614977 RepID=UPI000C857EEC|nr:MULTISPECIES: coniferyl aldehyde dehydrogenase [unclassified Vibrio]PMH33963.1 coniferyl-aldehyde dehydrogenase [Vibrio sp. 10N.286.49.C2]PMH44222.1 coniferyl-aldehyde dehydrogenase [Vibrio sp. 10N.286.49.B1]PMH82926.1 coniferyl-aldehyde dehydrogenase [Vibrio sp. 10N.286.48.B7]
MSQVELNETLMRERFHEQQQAFKESPFISRELRLNNLSKLERIIRDNQALFCEAIAKDFGHRSSTETALLEFFSSIDGVVDARKNLKKWMKPKTRHTAIWFKPAKNRVMPQPIGVVGVIVPWNYPLFLSIGPMTAALAAGNRVMVKMSENSQHLCRALAQAFSSSFTEDEICFIAETGETGPAFSKLAFDHLIFTGSGATGRKVMASAAENLTPVTLELGGKSPTIIASDYDVKKAMKRILAGKVYNSGQTCVAPDYLFVPEEKLDAVVESAKSIVKKRFKSIEHRDYTSVIDAVSFQRLSDTLQSAKEGAGEVINLIPDSEPDAETRRFPIHLVVSPATNEPVMTREIFGPILPILTYKTMDDVYHFISERDRPLALYLFSNDKALQKATLENTLSGGVTINDVMLHVGQHDLPFGGVGPSGMGHYHGREGFNSLSKMRPVMIQGNIAATGFLCAPYSGFSRRMINFLINRKWGKYPN